ncbi:hypothetical protein LL033_09960 [Clostridium estertheticum]|uniref:hypothetical protein n=1 Tax=Clostridium estertheticum TaxID=238834 RepID=UPI001C0AB955|nr:hypothetical protein [Clostridium estertheticum]MBU3217793.1 hypothetical protein [Clostridium estertheticum]WAG57480.1 hypothetical protein LL033_09960 [Clostridium estertheticum]
MYNKWRIISNQWIKEEKILKYYFYGIKVAGEKRFSTEYEDNKPIILARNKYPIYAFVREDKKTNFNSKGSLYCLKLVKIKMEQCILY